MPKPKKYKSKKDLWQAFSAQVEKHIDEYVLPQYGDFPDEHINELTIEAIKGKLSSYVRRIGTVDKHRGEFGAVQDMYKIAHFCSFVWQKLNAKE